MSYCTQWPYDICSLGHNKLHNYASVVGKLQFKFRLSEQGVCRNQFKTLEQSRVPHFFGYYLSVFPFPAFGHYVAHNTGFLIIRYTPYGPEWLMVYDLFSFVELNHILPIRQMMPNRSMAHIFLPSAGASLLCHVLILFNLVYLQPCRSTTANPAL